jgi:hypothetical protein
VLGFVCWLAGFLLIGWSVYRTGRVFAFGMAAAMTFNIAGTLLIFG